MADVAVHIPPVAACTYPVRGGNLVRPMVDGVSIFRRIGEAIEAARRSVWLTVAFYADDFAFPDGRGALFDLLDRTVARGVDVRMLAWRPNPELYHDGRLFGGTPADRAMLAARGSRVRIRWDRAATVYCQHQKCWTVDAGTSDEIAFLGGANLTAMALSRHDSYIEIAGPAATDVHHNFVQRWNEASERGAPDGNWACDASDSMTFPAALSPPRGDSTVQIQRMLHAGRYSDGRPPPGGAPFDVARGEHAVLDQYRQAIDAARRTIYIENQAIPVPDIADHLLRALARGVEVVLLTAADPEPYVYRARRDPAQQARFRSLETLAAHRNFLLAGIAARQGAARQPTYVHGKLMIVDDVWATVGSCNLHAYSLQGHSEMNAAIWDPAVVRSLRAALYAKHLDIETEALDDAAALRLFARTARDNRLKLEKGDPAWQGDAFAFPATRYAVAEGEVP